MPNPPLKTTLQAELAATAEAFGGVLGYSLRMLDPEPDSLDVRGDEMFPSASLIKVAILCYAMTLVDSGDLDWAEPIFAPPATKGKREAGGPAYHFRNQTCLPLAEWLHLMICLSDNTATIALRNLLGQGAINMWLHGRGFRVTRLLNGAETDILQLNELRQEYGLGVTTPNEMTRLLESILDHSIASPAACDRMLRLLSHQYWDDFFLSQIPPMTPRANKTGAVDASRSDAAIIFAPKGRYILAAFTKNQKDTRWEADNEGDLALRKISALVWQYHAPESEWKPPAGAEKFYPIGG